MRVRANSRWLIWFLLGLGSQLQIVASLSMTELAIFVMAPVLLFSELPYMRRNGIMPLFWFAVWMVIGCIVSSLYNHSPFPKVLRGLAATTLLPCTVVVMHSMLRKDMKGYGWYLLGGCISFFLCTFFFQHSFEVESLAGGARGAAAVEDIVSGPIYWVTRLGSLASVWPRGWYLSCPTAYCVVVPVGMALFSVLTTSSGRGVALSNLAGVCLVLIGRKKIRSMKLLAKNFWIFCICGVVGLLIVNRVYKYAALNGLMGEKARDKYIKQTTRGTDVVSLIIGGRADAIAGLVACLDHPIVGYGPWPVDNGGYMATFLKKYGSVEDYEDYLASEQLRIQMGCERLMPGHSHIFGSWLTYGLPGCLFWIYVLFVTVRFVRQDCWVVPQYFFWLVASVPGTLWNIFFSPMSDRIMPSFLCVAMLMVRAVRKGRQQLPPSMEMEIFRNERSR